MHQGKLHGYGSLTDSKGTKMGLFDQDAYKPNKSMIQSYEQESWIAQKF